MHEWAIAQGLLNTALEEAGKHSARQINLFRIKLGDGNQLEPSSIEFCLDALSKGTIAEGAIFEIETISGWESFIESIEVEQEG